MKHLSTDSLFRKPLSSSAGMTLVEVIIALAVGIVLLASLGGIVGKGLDLWKFGSHRSELLDQGNFAMEQMIDAVTKTRRLLIPLADNSGTAHDESLRDILAVTLDPVIDRDGDGWADANNDKDFFDINGNTIRDADEVERVDEDIPVDNSFDGQPGIIGIDDDNDGSIDENIGGGDWYTDNDEDGLKREDHIDGLDNDGDGSIDEDIPKDNDKAGGSDATFDNDGDGLKSEDWLDPVVFYVSTDGKSLVQRLPVAGAVDGSTSTNHIIARADTIKLSVQRFASGIDDRSVLIEINLALANQTGETVILQSHVRAGGGK